MNAAILINLAYIASAILFILGLKQLSSPETARRGNFISSVGMLLAIVRKVRDINDAKIVIERDRLLKIVQSLPVDAVKYSYEQRRRCRHQDNGMGRQVLIGCYIGNIHDAELDASYKCQLQTVLEPDTGRAYEGSENEKRKQKPDKRHEA